jgi:hypothetical protein
LAGFRNAIQARRAPTPDLHIGQSDIRALVRDQLRQLDREIEAALRARARSHDADPPWRIHLEDARVRVARALEP